MNWSESELKSFLLEQEMKKGKSLQDATAALECNSKWGHLFQDPEKAAKTERSKMGNKIVSVDGMKFHSQKEADYYCDLKIRLRTRDIRTFAKQAPFILNDPEDGGKPVIYIADFVVWELDGRVRIIDIKPSATFQTKEYKLKRRLFESGSGLKIEEIYEV